MAVHTIGTGGNFSTPQAWEDDIPGTLTEQRIGQLKKQEFESTGISIPIEFSAHVTTPSFNIILECEAGASFKDDPNVRTNPLRYDPAKGAAIKMANNRGIFVNGSVDHLIVRGIQLLKVATNYYPTAVLAQGNGISTPAVPHLFKDLIVEVTGTDTGINCVQFGHSADLVNTLIVARNTALACGFQGKDVATGQTFRLIGCTVVGPSNLTDFGIGIQNLYGGNSLIVKNTAIFGFATDVSGIHSNSDYNATDKSDPSSNLPGTHNVYSVPYDTTLFEQPSDSGGNHDFRAKAGCGLDNAGLLDAASPTDITGLTRTDPVTIGAWELVATGGYRLLQDGNGRRILENGNDYRVLEGTTSVDTYTAGHSKNWVSPHIRQ